MKRHRTTPGLGTTEVGGPAPLRQALRLVGIFAVVLLIPLAACGNQEKTGAITTSSTTASTTASATRTTTRPPTTTTTTTTTTSAMASGEIIVNFSIASGDAVGKDQAVACPDPVVFLCIVIETQVMDDNGKLSGATCNMSWRAYHGDSQDVWEKGRGDCGNSIGLGEGPMEAGPYRVEVDIEMDDGTKGSGLYRFTMLAE